MTEIMEIYISTPSDASIVKEIINQMYRSEYEKRSYTEIAESIVNKNEVYVIATQKKYILDSKGIWHSKAIGDNSIIECDCVEESTIWEELPN